MTTPKRISMEKIPPKDTSKYDTATSIYIGVFDDLTELLGTPANNNDYAFFRYEDDDFHLVGDKYVYDEDLRQWVYLYSIRLELKEKIREQRIEYKIEQLEKELKHLKKLQRRYKDDR